VLGLVSAAVAVLAVLAVAGPVAAHVTVHPTSLPAGSQDAEITFRVPNERDDANTVRLQVFFPTSPPFLTLDVLPVTGWTSRVHVVNLPAPVQSPDGPVTQVVSDITWTATAGGLSPGQYEDFAVSVGSLPGRPGPVVFKALQTYSSGEVVRWIELPTPEVPAPNTPAPVLTLTVTPTGRAPAGRTKGGGSGSAEALAVTALVLSGLGLAGVVALWARGRRTTGR
jgi:uncharacterized protein YcnI